MRVDLETAAERIGVSKAREVEEKIRLATGSRVNARLASIKKSLNAFNGLRRPDDAESQPRRAVGLQWPVPHETETDIDFPAVAVFAREIQGVMCHMVVAIVPDRDGKDFVPSQVILDATQNFMVAAVNRLTLISCLEERFARVQVFGTEGVLGGALVFWQPGAGIDLRAVLADMRRCLTLGGDTLEPAE